MTKTETKPPLAALGHIVEYLIDNGEQNFFENGCEKDHVFVAVMKVAKWLSAPPYGRMDWTNVIEHLEERIAEARADETA